MESGDEAGYDLLGSDAWIIRIEATYNPCTGL